MNKTLTDAEGNTYELRDMSDFTGTDKQEYYAIRPITPQPKKQYKLDFWDRTNDHPLVEEKYNLTESQAESIKEAITALMDYIQTPDTEDRPFFSYDFQMMPKINKARKAIQGED